MSSVTQFDFDVQTVQVTSKYVWPILKPDDQVLYRRTTRSGGQFFAKAVLVRKPADMQRRATIKVRGRDADNNVAWQTKSVETYTLFRGNWDRQVDEAVAEAVAEGLVR